MEKVNIGLIGLGTVGTGVVKIIQENQALFKERIGVKLCLKKVVDIDLERDRGIDLSTLNLSNDISEILNDEEIEIVVELIGGYEPARSYILTALREGKHVVTANKALLSKNWEEIIETAKEANRGIYFEASVGGGIPLILSITKGLAGDKILSLNGILNGTCNYILTKMTNERIEFEKALIDAQEKGYAEADSSLDINGDDSAHKLTILSSLSFGQYINLEDVYVEGITKITKEDCIYALEEFNCIIKLLAIAQVVDGKLDLRVHPTLIPQKHLLSKVGGAYNALYIRGDNVGELLFYGMGAGQLPTASAVVNDIISITTKIKKNNLNFSEIFPTGKKILPLLPLEELRLRYYIRFSTVDRPGVLAKIAGILGDKNISIASVVQKESFGREVVFVVMLTHKALEKDVREALSEIDRLDVVKEKSVLIRVCEIGEDAL
jgi:homoserine dehydrogenase